MNLYLRLLGLLGQYVLPRAPQPMTQEVRTTFRVWPHDLDTNLHMNNGRFLTLMDLGRLDFMAKTGLLWPSLRQRIASVLGASQMVYLRPLKLGQRFDLVTRLACWDDKWFVMEQRFEYAGATCALGRVRGVFQRRGRTLPPMQALRDFGVTELVSPAASAGTEAWLASLRTR